MTCRARIRVPDIYCWSNPRPLKTGGKLSRLAALLR